MSALATLEPRVDTAPKLSCAVVGSFDDCAELQEEWDELVAAVGGHLYLTYDWCRIWWDHYGDERELRVFLFRAADDGSGGDGRDERLVGVVPVCIGRSGVWPLRLRLAKIVGSDSALTLCDICVDAAFASEIFAMLFHQLRRDVDAISITPLPADYPHRTGILQAARASGTCVVAERSCGVYTAYHLPASLQEYIESLAHDRRGIYRKQLRQFTKRHQFRSDVITAPEDGAAEFERFRAMHDEQWHAEGRLGHFGDWPRAVEFNRALVRRMAELGRLRMVRSLAGEQVVAYHYCYLFGRKYYSRLPARRRGAEWDKFGLGNIVYVENIAEAIREGANCLEAGIGHYDYKLQWGGTEHDVRSLLIVRDRPYAKLRCAAFARACQLLHLLYYRIWFLRIAPKLPALRRPLWKTWIRSRV